MIIDRVRAGYPKKGLIWHFQGSGKSYLMEFAAVKLRMLPDLKNPTVIIVDDRLDLESQIMAQFHSSDVGNLESASTREQLMTMLRQDIRKIIITTIFRFQEVTSELSPRDNIIVMVDECHRTQEGDLGIKMRTALPNAFFFGMTGTPINRLDKLLGENCSTIVMDTNDDKADEYKAYRRSKDEEAKVLDRFRDPNDPLEIVIVTVKRKTSLLLTTKC